MEGIEFIARLHRCLQRFPLRVEESKRLFHAHRIGMAGMLTSTSLTVILRHSIGFSRFKGCSSIDGSTLQTVSVQKRSLSLLCIVEKNH